MFTSKKKFREQVQAHAETTKALCESIEFNTVLLAENARRRADAMQSGRDLIESLGREIELQKKLDDKAFLSAVGVKVG